MKKEKEDQPFEVDLRSYFKPFKGKVDPILFEDSDSRVDKKETLKNGGNSRKPLTSRRNPSYQMRRKG